MGREIRTDIDAMEEFARQLSSMEDVVYNYDSKIQVIYDRISSFLNDRGMKLENAISLAYADLSEANYIYTCNQSRFDDVKYKRNNLDMSDPSYEQERRHLDGVLDQMWRVQKNLEDFRYSLSSRIEQMHRMVTANREYQSQLSYSCDTFRQCVEAARSSLYNIEHGISQTIETIRYASEKLSGGNGSGEIYIKDIEKIKDFAFFISKKKDELSLVEMALISSTKKLNENMEDSTVKMTNDIVTSMIRANRDYFEYLENTIRRLIDGYNALQNYRRLG